MTSDEALTRAASSVGSPYGMSVTDVLSHILAGDRPHGDAPDTDCGAVDPRNEAEWCRLDPGHSGDHNRYSEAAWERICGAGPEDAS